jgi:DNA ligase D-like protein (predicted polymerase)
MAEERVSAQVGSRTLSLSNLDKVLWPRDRYTKGDLIAYYEGVAPYMVPHLKNRPLTLERFPNGVDASAFFEKQIPKGMPDWVDRVVAPTPGGSRNQTTFVVCNDAPSLVYLANLAAIVLHIWTSRIPDLDEPDFVIFDLDPGERCTLRTLSAVALTVQRLLEEIGLKVLVKTTGGYGLHVVLQGLWRAGCASCRGGARRSSHAAADDRQASAGGGLSRLRTGRIGQDDRRAVLGARARCRAGFDAVALVRGRSLRPAARRDRARRRVCYVHDSHHAQASRTRR